VAFKLQQVDGGQWLVAVVSQLPAYRLLSTAFPGAPGLAKGARCLLPTASCLPPATWPLPLSPVYPLLSAVYRLPLRHSTLTQFSALYPRNGMAIAYCYGGKLPAGRAKYVEFSAKFPTGGIFIM